MDPVTLQAIATVLVAVAFFGVCWWAYAPSRKGRFEDAGMLPFADEDEQLHKKSGMETNND